MAYYKQNSYRLSTESIQLLSHFYTILISQKLRAFPNIAFYACQIFLPLDPYLLFMQRNPYTLHLRRCHRIAIFFFSPAGTLHVISVIEMLMLFVNIYYYRKLLCSVSKFLRAKKKHSIFLIYWSFILSHTFQRYRNLKLLDP